MPPTRDVTGRLVPVNEMVTAAGLHVALCKSEGGVTRLGNPCTLLARSAEAGPEGYFSFEDVPVGTYYVLVEAGLGDFEAALERWGGQTLQLGDWPWLYSALLGAPPGTHINLLVPDPLPTTPAPDRIEYAVQTLQFEGTPFVLAHRIEVEGDQAHVEPVLARVTSEGVAPVTVLAVHPATPDLEPLRARIGPLTREEIALLDRDLVARWARVMNGEASAFQDTDARVIELLRSGAIHALGGAQFTGLEVAGGLLVKAAAYQVIDPQTGERTTVAYYDPASGDVVELSTGYRLNVRDNPGIRMEPGPEGEQWYHYGFSYYRRWGRVLPDPIIGLLDRFYATGADYVERNITMYAAAARSFGGDLDLIPWDSSTGDLIRAYLPDADYPPFTALPDSGTVDIRRERFLRAQIDGAVEVDANTLARFLSSEVLNNSSYNSSPDRQDVIDTLLIPYRSGHLFNDLEALLILGATYADGGEGPLRVVLQERLGQGFMVPRSGEKVIYVAPNELANVLLGYPGALNSRWGHEMAHLIDFRSPQYEFRAAGGRVCEPLKYMIEFMWWVERYPGDAPDTDWLPINSGLALARLLTGQFHNSGC